MKRLIAAMIAATALLVIALPASAGNSTPTGVRLGISFGGTSSRQIQATTAFFVKGGFGVDDPASGCNPCDTVSDVQQSQFNLSVDGVKQNGVTIQEFSTTKPRTLTAKFFLYNFPNGLPAGTYVFHIEYVIRGQVVTSRDVTVNAVDTCQYGTTDGLLCAPPPA